MIGAAMLSHNLGLLPEEVVERSAPFWRSLAYYRYSGVGLEAVLSAMELDKKVRRGQ